MKKRQQNYRKEEILFCISWLIFSSSPGPLSLCTGSVVRPVTQPAETSQSGTTQHCSCQMKPSYKPPAHLHRPPLSPQTRSSSKNKTTTKETKPENIQTIKKLFQHFIILLLHCLKDYKTMIKEIFHLLIYSFSFQVWN